MRAASPKRQPTVPRFLPGNGTFGGGFNQMTGRFHLMTRSYRSP
jgi:hypothetical protein